MILHRLRLIHKNQRGFTLIELLIALLVTGIITGSITMTIFQVFTGNTRSTNHMIAVRQVQNAGYWLSRDAQMAQSVVLTADPDGFPLTLTWTEWDGTKHQVVYSLEDMTGGSKQLEKQHLTYDADGNEVGNETTIVAQFINPDPTKTNCQFDSGTFSLPDVDDAFTISDAVGGDTGTITVTAGSISVTGPGTWTDPNWSTTAGQTIIVTATAANTEGVWTVTTGTATAIITEDATVTGGVLIFTVTAKLGTGSQEESETRIYRIIPRPGA